MAVSPLFFSDPPFLLVSTESFHAAEMCISYIVLGGFAFGLEAKICPAACCLGHRLLYDEAVALVLYKAVDLDSQSMRQRESCCLMSNSLHGGKAECLLLSLGRPKRKPTFWGFRNFKTNPHGCVFSEGTPCQVDWETERQATIFGVQIIFWHMPTHLCNHLGISDGGGGKIN